MSRHRYTLLDVFTDTRLAGNQLAVVHAADGVADATMHAFARETKLSETTFVQSADAGGADYRNRIWMIGGEIPFAGHPSLGTAVAEARARGLTSGSVRYVQQTGAGLQPVEVELTGDGGTTARASMLQEPAVPGPEPSPDRALAAIGLAADDGDPELPPQFFSTGVPQLLVPLRAGALARCAPDYDAIAALCDPEGAIVLYAAEVDATTGTARARGFCTTVEAGEDPATGSAAGPLCAYVHALAGASALAITQGVEMGRPAKLRTAIDGDRVRVGGDVVVVVDGAVLL